MIRRYLLSVVTCALAVSLVCSVPQKKGIARIASALGGVILLITFLQPLLRLRVGDLGTWLDRYAPDDSLISSAMEEREKESSGLISEQTRAYILDKARALGADLEVEIELAALSEHYCYPYRVTLRGQWLPDQKKSLSSYIADTLGIPEERQIWIMTEE